MAHRLTFRASARDDLQSIYVWIADAAGPEIAFDYVERIRSFCEGLTSFPKRGTPRGDIAPHLRTVVFERRATIAYTVHRGEVQIVRILHRGRELGSAFNE